MIDGELTVNGEALRAGDGVSISGADELRLEARDATTRSSSTWRRKPRSIEIGGLATDASPPLRLRRSARRVVRI